MSTQAITIDEYYAAQHPLVVDARLAEGLREKRFQRSHLRIARPVWIAHVTAPLSEPWITQHSGNQCILSPGIGKAGTQRPWMFPESRAQCSVSLRFNGHRKNTLPALLWYFLLHPALRS